MWGNNSSNRGWYNARLFKVDNYLLPIHPGRLQKVRNLDGRPNDIYVASFTKAGTTWTQEMVYMIATDLDFRSSAALTLQRRFPYLDMGILPIDEPCSLTALANMPRGQPRFIKVHLPHHLLPHSAYRLQNKIIYVTRNPSDVMVSCFHFYVQILGTYFGSFGAFFNDFMGNRLPYCPFLEHVMGYWSRREDPNIIFITYEDLHTNFRGVAQKVAKFLGKDFTDKQFDQLEEHCSFRAMKKNPSVNYMSEPVMNQSRVKFMRKGIIGDWTNYLSVDMQRRVERWCERRLSGTGFSFQFLASSKFPPSMPPAGLNDDNEKTDLGGRQPNYRTSGRVTYNNLSAKPLELTNIEEIRGSRGCPAWKVAQDHQRQNRGHRPIKYSRQYVYRRKEHGLNLSNGNGMQQFYLPAVGTDEGDKDRKAMDCASLNNTETLFNNAAEHDAVAGTGTTATSKRLSDAEMIGSPHVDRSVGGEKTCVTQEILY